MARKKTRETREIENLLKREFPDFPGTHPPEAYRYNSASIRVRLVSDRFRGKDRGQREDMVLPVLRALPEDTQADLMILLLLTPEEVEGSVMNMEFEHPSPSRL